MIFMYVCECVCVCVSVSVYVSGGLGVWMRVGCSCPPVCNNYNPASLVKLKLLSDNIRYGFT